MKSVVITGCSRGLGEAMVKGFQAMDYQVFGCSSNPKLIAAMADDSHFQCCDVADDSAVESFASYVINQIGNAPDLLINNAALMNINAPLWEVPAEEFSRLVDVNISGVANMIRHFVPPMIDRGSGVIVNFSSYWGRSASSDVAPYCASKWAIEGLNSGLAQDLPRGLAAVALNPGIIATDMLRSCFGPGADANISPEDWAEAAVPFIDGFDASNNSDSVTVPGQ